MLMPDVNVLVYAHRADEDPRGAYRRWVEHLVAGAAPFALSTLVAVGFLRIVTNRRVYSDPTPLSVAASVIDSLVARANCCVVGPGERHVEHVLRLCRAARSSGKEVADAQHAAVAIEHGCTWVTCDDDFAAFARHGLTWQHLVL